MPNPTEKKLNSLNVGKIGILVSDLLTDLVCYQKDYEQYLAAMRLYNLYKNKYPNLTRPFRPITLTVIGKKQVEINKLRRLLGRATINILAEIREYKRELHEGDES